jgi:hypothetical protein
VVLMREIWGNHIGKSEGEPTHSMHQANGAQWRSHDGGIVRLVQGALVVACSPHKQRRRMNRPS